MPHKPEVAVFYFPNYHADARNEARYGRGWTEYDLVSAATPRWPGHRQPVEPAWGAFDEADPAWMAKQIDLAADHGITTFLFDWYWYNDGPFLERALDEGFLAAPNRDRLKFALMWANHNWHDIFPAGPRSQGESELLYPGAVTPETWDLICDVVIDRYFSQPNYLRVDGKPFFSFFEFERFLDGLGGVAGAAEGIRKFREKAVQAGHPGVHLNAMAGNVGSTVGSPSGGDTSAAIRQLQLDSVTDYCFVFHYGPGQGGFPQDSYEKAAAANIAAWDHLPDRFGVPYYPNVSMGWDCTSRCSAAYPYESRGYPWTSALEGNTPEAFRQALKNQRDWALAHDADLVTLNAWNEWTEGSYLLPDTVYGNAYLEAIKDVYGVE